MMIHELNIQNSIRTLHLTELGSCQKPFEIYLTPIMCHNRKIIETVKILQTAMEEIRIR